MSDKKITSLFSAVILTEELEERIDIIRHKLKFIEIRPTVACIKGISPLMIAGNWTPELVAIAGGKSILAKNGQHSSFINFEAIQSEDPDMMLIMPCGFSIQQTLQEIHLLTDLSKWNELTAVKNDRIYIADGSQHFDCSNTQPVNCIEILAEIIHPKQFIFGYEGNGWIKFIS